MPCHPLGIGWVPGCVMGACLGRCDFPMTERCNSRLGFSHKAIALIHCFTSKAMRTPTLKKGLSQASKVGGGSR